MSRAREAAGLVVAEEAAVGTVAVGVLAAAATVAAVADTRLLQ